MPKAEVVTFFEEETCTACYLLTCPETKKAAIIDSVLGFKPNDGSTDTSFVDKVLAHVKDNGLTVDWILETHAHADHLTASAYIKKQLGGGTIGIGEHITVVQGIFKDIFGFEGMVPDGHQFDKLFKDGETFKVGNLEVNIMHTPGHTPACICYYVKDDVIFTGDTIFMPDMGSARCDFPAGSSQNLWNSIQKILSLPEDVRVFVGHDYKPGRDEYKWESTIKEQRDMNKHVKAGTEEGQFVSWRKERDDTLSAPRLIIPSVQVNILAGHFPKSEKNGRSYLKTPVNVLKVGSGAVEYPGSDWI
eukprot:GFYU01004046.1.p1 GENE.GFYU01004046.1~~GFYU01004046.1.p1  ORF type:complete len:304 (+),score=87.59 GFYU01004046.1:137-1048(+)